MTTTIKDVEEYLEKVEDLPLFLAGVRSTLFELAMLGKKHCERADLLQARVEELQEEVLRLRDELGDVSSYVGDEVM